MRYRRKLSKRKRLTFVVIFVSLAGAISYSIIDERNSKAEEDQFHPVESINDETPGSADPAQPIDEPEEPDDDDDSQWPVQLSLEQAKSLTVVVNKKHKLPSNYVPARKAVAGGEMRPEAADALTELLEAAEIAGVPMEVLSSYRSYSTQQSVYNNYVAQDGRAAADTYSARPGHSEHQTGLAVDLGNGTCDLETCFGDTAAGKWLAAHAHEFGFIIRYEKGKDSITGYQYEPWHIRYVGDVAGDIVNSGKTMDEYYNVPAGGYN